MKVADIFDVDVKKEIASLMTDSRFPSQQAMFFCLQGFSFDGHDFIDAAIANGAICIVHSKEITKRQKNITYLQVNDVRLALNHAINSFYRQCFKEMQIIGVTGSAGKSSVAFWLKALLDDYLRCGYLGSLALEFDGRRIIDNFGNLEAVTLGAKLAAMYDKGAKACALALPNSVLELENADFLDFSIGIFTDVTSDLLDMRGRYSYLAAKAHLFDRLQKEQLAIVNNDSIAAGELTADCVAKVVTYGINRRADYRAVDVRLGAKGSSFTLLHDRLRYPVETNAIALFNLYNLLAVIAALHQSRLELPVIIEKLAKLPVVPGRMELIDEGQAFNVIVDYAHTPEAFLEVLRFAKTLTPNRNRIITVFGAPGQRESSKRILLGKTADTYSDLIILTEEDQRNENPREIANQIAQGIKRSEYYFVGEREYAIEQAILVAQKGDTVVILAKGDELFIDRGLGKMMYNYKGDAQIARNCLRANVR